MDMNITSLKGKVGKVGEFGGGISVILAVVSDFLSPVGGSEYGLYLVILAIFMLVISYFLYIYPKSDEWLRQKAPNYWYWPTLITLLLAIGVMSFSLMLTNEANNNPDNKKSGYLASKLPLVEGMQKQLHIINKNLVDINANTKATADNTGVIKEVVKTLKKETSDNPRKELANLSIEWSADAYEAAILRGDTQAIKLFLAGGMVVDSFGQSYYYIEYPLALSKRGTEVVRLLLNRGLKKEKIDQNRLISLSITYKNCDLLNALHKLGLKGPKRTSHSYYNSSDTFASVCKS